MARFFGKVGYGETVEEPPGSGKYISEIVERDYRGDVIRTSRTLQGGEKINSDISVGNSISIVADKHAIKHFLKIKYVNWAGTRWTVDSVEVRSPRLILNLGSVYNGPTT